MKNFSLFRPFFSKKQNQWTPGVKPEKITNIDFEKLLDDPQIASICKEFEETGNKKLKLQLPAVCWVATFEGNRCDKNAVPTQYFMVDVDHIAPQTSPSPSQGGELVDTSDPKEYVRKVWEEIKKEAIAKGLISTSSHEEGGQEGAVMLAHITPSGRGLRIVCKATKDFPTIAEHMEWLGNELHLNKYGEFDTVVKDFARLSFMVPGDHILFQDPRLFEEEEVKDGPIFKEVKEYLPKKSNADAKDSQAKTLSTNENSEGNSQSLPLGGAGEGLEDGEALKDFTFNGFKVSEIAEEYVKFISPDGVEEGRKHSVYNQLVKDFRHICNNDPNILYAVLPKFEPTNSDRLSQCKSICKENNIGMELPPKFDIFLRQKGYSPLPTSPRGGEGKNAQSQQGNSQSLPLGGAGEGLKDKEDEDYFDDEQTFYRPAPLPKKLPPVFREILSGTPDIFKLPAVNALLPIMGTMTSWLRAEYPNDFKIHSTEFFAVNYAPPSTGKAFIERFQDLLLSDLEKRDELTMLRDQIYNAVCNKKGDSKDKPDLLRTSVRLIPARNSLGEALKKQVANNGHHVYTYAAEVDEWAKGVKAAGADKDDLMRIAWDNGKYGQMFQSPNTFKGTVKVYWNVLMCGTPGQVYSYFKNPENGLVSRASFIQIPKIRYTTAAKWKRMTKKQLEVIEKFKKRCDERTYKEPLKYNVEDAYQYGNDLEAFDREVPYQYDFKPTQQVNLDWLFKEIEGWQVKQNLINKVNKDECSDDFIPRVMIRGFRLGLLCYGLWDKVGKEEKEIIKNFVLWWMPEDLRAIKEAWEARHKVTKVEKKTKRDDFYDLLPDEFTKENVDAAKAKAHLSQDSTKLISVFVKKGIFEKIEKGRWRKLVGNKSASE